MFVWKKAIMMTMDKVVERSLDRVREICNLILASKEALLGWINLNLED